MNPPEQKKKPPKKIISEAFDLAASAMQARMWETHKAEEIADFCVVVARTIHDSDIDTDD